MTIENKSFKRIVSVLGLALFIGGCASDSRKEQLTLTDDFASPDQPRAVDRFVQTQCAAGARSDATLYAYHFDGNELNSLGRQKLGFMLKDDDACEPLTVYFDFTGDPNGAELAKNRHGAVKTFLVDEGLVASAIELKDGPNPFSSVSAAEGIKAMTTAAPVSSTPGTGSAIAGASK